MYRPLLTILVTLLFYAVVIMLLRYDIPVEQPAEQLMADRKIIGIPDLLSALGLALALVVDFCLLPVVGTAAGFFLYVACTAGGPVLAAYVIFPIVRIKRILVQD